MRVDEFKFIFTAEIEFAVDNDGGVTGNLCPDPQEDRSVGILIPKPKIRRE